MSSASDALPPASPETSGAAKTGFDALGLLPGLLRAVAHRATVGTTEDSEFLVIERDDFLAAISHGAESIRAFDDVIARRLYA